MKIAVVTDNGKTVCQHFGRAQYYLVASIENGSVTGKEQRPKAGHHTAGMSHEHNHAAGACHGFNAHSQSIHAGMVSNITDCQLVIAGGMGMGARQSLEQAGIDVHMTDVADIDIALKLYLEGKLPNLTERLH
ncbi:dinitrogenase iron-molybdenum cofactor biosynthesis protein [Dehalococcoides mccartyi]|jgi:predicted Fe-Mo cluster-binding NifX family protein|uniref:NifB/NifX family molybdenum-iron cluster-binding protein n=1 Tax=Dehalococcoides TaxID=61434 RepID=UPI0004E03E0F|nr:MULTISPECIES: NifB/NifX family molybdenum-iron cluster-binding protein [Dehalococcoides]AII58527.1 dinitrogenase iron-molybdenum cofactor biosynthesis protein [Dehalococcoides mccartyi CG1]APH13139.1 dinitrogenase iron-molybdenum cofactor biosynthesis protein [Dehalococcoides mccartyi]QYY58748.1 dinitrogenase iron-molybdenum cofactor biosynthesis protein [Dehalococcoides mccartyi]BAQ35350.1 dinitrogenase iron-molybdenum cofactor family protein [Dehalococcoides sp. UCH007]